MINESLNIKRENMILDGLNEEQKEALLYFDGPLRIIAGAGSGKTRVLTRKIAYLINILGISPTQILAVTFTNKAANEMAERIKQYTNTKFTKDIPEISTFHSLCAKILRQEAFHVNLKNDFQIIDDIDKKNVLKDVYKKLNIEPVDTNFKNIIRIISWAKNKNYTSDELLHHLEDEIDASFKDNGRHVALIFDEYNKTLKEMKSLDFDDLISKVNELFQTNNDVANKWASMYSYILVDEFQDTSSIQYEIIKVLSSKNAQVTIVGDPDQTIYRFRGANVNLILDFHKDFKDCKTIILNKNYRSTQSILNAANSLIKHNHFRFNKDLVTDREQGLDIEFIHAFSPDAEVRWVVQKINELKKQKIQLKNIAIFYRSNSYSRNFEEQLMNENINYKIFGGEKFYQRKEIKDALAFLRVLYDKNELQLARIINVPPRRIGDQTLQKIYEASNEFGLSLYQTLLKHFKDLPVNMDVKKNIVKFLNCVNKYSVALSSNPINVVLDRFLDEIGYYEYINDDVALKGTGEENIKTLIDGIRSWEEKNTTKSIKDYFEYVSLLSANDSSDESLNYVSLMTVHSAKGLEFDNVFLVGMSEQIFPHYRSGDDSESLEEERRLAYVAITRARNRLFVSDSRGKLFNSETDKQPSRFLKEMGIDVNAYILQKESGEVFEDTEIDDKKIKEWNKKMIPGDVISHTFFGEGTILEVKGDTIVVQFASNNIKVLAKNHMSVRLLKQSDSVK
ncbi:ATP-dependent helicase [Mycoplasmopsis felifaucium]|uniref:ATP-dependent helicase n=1 Tax=Mycoplasmopsis felifaucium TaxID=35768 RepID=UPI00047F8AC7|nr:UvrD-helicase domain-containing protein [Mycoplasmopsis felifaucium]